MSYLIVELFERHDRSRFEVFGYCTSPEDGSLIRARVINSFDHYVCIKNMTDEEAARRIRADEIDILIDLNGLTLGVRPQILRAKPAPVQATYLGFVGPVPLPELDYMFCDRVVVPPDQASAYTPKPLYIAKNYQANDTKRTLAPATTRSTVGLPDNKFVFCCFSNHYKITEEMFTAWMEILRRCDNAIIWLVGSNQRANSNILERAAVLGVDPDCIVFAARVGPDEYMARFSLADVFLDTFPYNAGTIASDVWVCR
jgi:predicted O-linked N-acetylglucosamine transferase (SPINDLY family)